MIRVILVLIILMVQGISYCKPYQGKYILTGKIYDHTTLKPLTNKVFFINEIAVKSDSNGIYKVEIEWKTADSFYFNNYRKKLEENKKLNLEYIEIVYL